jgi:predicted amidohydrolase
MKIGYIQMTPVWGDKDQNLATADRLIRNQNADLLVLPEFFNTGYLFLDRDEVIEVAESVPDGMTTQRLKDIASETDTYLVAGLPEIFNDTLYNSAVLVAPNGNIGTYRKTHLFDREKEFFEPGDTGFHIWQVEDIRLGIMICFDWIYPESARTLALMGADVIAHPSNLVLPYCPEAMVTRCLENRLFAITCNRSGSEDRNGNSLNYIGNSRIIAPNGNVLSAAGSELESVSVVDIDVSEARMKSVTPNNSLLKDRRSKHYFVENPCHW